MPPKKQGGQAPSKKTVEKKKEKVIEDKTFGIKNKKGKKQQTYIKQVTNQVKFGGGQSIAKREGDVYQQKKEKAQKEKEMSEIQGLFKPVQQTQKISAGADPKSVLCLFFKQGSCTKGDKCKFSHDLSLENKAEKRSMYVDARDNELEEDTIDKWDTDKLSEVVQKKHSTKTKTKTDIVCKHFLQAIEKGLYGWFWECPSGGDKCIYRHALPPGFVLKRMQKEQEDMQPQDAITLEELVENEREALISSGKTLTKVTLESFMAWKKRKLREKSEKAESAVAQRKEAFHQGKTLGISGREMFLFNPDLVGGDDQDEEGGAVLQVTRPEPDEDEEEGIDMATMLANIGDGDEIAAVKSEGEPSSAEAKLQVSDSEDDDRGGAVGGASGEANTGAASVMVDEQLFEEGFEDIVDPETMDGDGSSSSNLPSSSADQPVDVDESLFDVDDLGTLNLDDPADPTLTSDGAAS